MKTAVTINTYPFTWRILNFLILILISMQTVPAEPEQSQTVDDRMRQVKVLAETLTTKVTAISTQLAEYSADAAANDADGIPAEELNTQWAELMNVLAKITAISKPASTLWREIGEAVTATRITIERLTKKGGKPDLVDIFEKGLDELNTQENRLEQIYTDSNQLKTVLLDQRRDFPYYIQAKKLTLVVEQLKSTVDQVETLVSHVKGIVNETPAVTDQLSRLPKG